MNKTIAGLTVAAPGENCYSFGRTIPDVRQIAAGPDWTVSEFICHAGPHDRPVEERHGAFTIAAVLEGSFIYRGDTGRALFHPGSFVLGNNEKCFECGHDHSRGDRCLSFQYSEGMFEEIALAAAGSIRYRFRTPILPVSPEMTPLLADIEADNMRAEEITASVASAVLRTMSGHTPNPVAVSASDERRICDAMHHIEDYSAEPLKLDDLARIAQMSKFHFLRIFRRAVGLSPYQFLLNQRMRVAARRLATSHQAISAVALEAGFSDLSTFNSRFRIVFGMSPTRYRRLRL